MKTWREVLALADGHLAKNGVPDSRVAAELLAARLLKTGRGFLAAHLEKPAEERLLEAMRRGVTRLARGEPVQYVLGEWDFRALTLKCDKRALIPRPETEELVTRVLAFLKARFPAASADAAPAVVDVGTGTGCIVLSLAREFKGPAKFIGIDVSPAAVELARENAAKCGLSDRVEFVVADGLDDFDEPEIFDAIVSNPPYVTTAECAALDPRIRGHEPLNALDGGAEGLDFYARFTFDAVHLLKPGGGLFYEIGETQGEAVRALMFEAGFDGVKIERDFAGRDRYAQGVVGEAF